MIANDTPAALKAHLGSTVIELGMGDKTRATRAQDLLSAEPAHPARARGRHHPPGLPGRGAR